MIDAAIRHSILATFLRLAAQGLTNFRDGLESPDDRCRGPPMATRKTWLYLFLLMAIGGAAGPVRADYLQTYVAATCDNASGRAMVRFGYGDANEPPKFGGVSKDVDGGLSEVPVANAAKVEASCSLSGNRKVRVRYVPGNNVADTLGEWTVWINKVEIVHGDANGSYPFAVIIERNGYRTCTFKLAEGQSFYDLTASVSPEHARPTPIECEKDLSPLARRDSISAAELQLMRSELIESDDELNEAYKARLGQLTTDRRASLQHQQRLWLRVRDLSCEISSRAESRDQWIKDLERDGEKMTCASQFARARAKALLNEVSITNSGYPAEEGPDLHFAPGSDPICKLIDKDLHSNPQSTTTDWDRWKHNELKWGKSSDPRQQEPKSQERDSSKGKALLELRAQSEGDFDFFNDGHVARVLVSSFGDHYMMGSTLLIEPTRQKGSVAAGVSDPISDPGSWFLPCQLESTRYPISECPPFSQAHDEAGLSVAAKGGKVVRFRGRYAFLNAVRVTGSTYVIVDGGDAGSVGYTAVLRPRPDRAFDTLCLVRH